MNKKVNYKLLNIIRERRKWSKELKRRKRAYSVIRRRIPVRIRSKRIKTFKKRRLIRMVTVVTAPPTLSLIENFEETVEFFRTIRKSLYKGFPIKMNLKDVVNLTPETLVLLCAYINDRSFTQGTPLSGNLPSEPTINKMFTEAGFFNHVRSYTTALRKRTRKNILYSQLIHRITQKKVLPKLAKRVSRTALKYVLGEEARHQQLYKVIIECMANTHNHASNIKSQKQNWWLLAYKVPDKKKVLFCFLDLGVGIINSLKTKYYQKTFLAVFKDKQRELIKELFVKENHATRTNLPERGRGLSTIYNAVTESSLIKRFTVITNAVSAIIDEDAYTANNHRFNGTLYYWELSND